jgi:2-methylcitrate synthase
MKMSNLLNEQPGTDKLFFANLKKVEEVMKREKNIVPNSDLFSINLVYQIGIDETLFLGLVMSGRITGLYAVAMEQRTLKKLIAPGQEWIGPIHSRVPTFEEREN